MSHVKMRPYGIRSEYRDEAYGPTTKFSGSMSLRRKYRRLMHRQGRIDGRAEVESQVRDQEQQESHGCGCDECQQFFGGLFGGKFASCPVPLYHSKPKASRFRMNLGTEVLKALLSLSDGQKKRIVSNFNEQLGITPLKR